VARRFAPSSNSRLLTDIRSQWRTSERGSALAIFLSSRRVRRGLTSARLTPSCSSGPFAKGTMWQIDANRFT